MTETNTRNSDPHDALAIHGIIESYRAWAQTLGGYMQRASDLLRNLYAEQDLVVDQLRQLCAKTHSLRHADFDAIFGEVFNRRASGESLSAMVGGYHARQQAVIAEAQEIFGADTAQAIKAWPALKERLLDQAANGANEIVDALRQVHAQQEKISTALSGLLMRGEKLKIDDLKTVAQRLSARDSRESAELDGLLALCESAGRDAETKWRRLAG